MTNLLDLGTPETDNAVVPAAELEVVETTLLTNVESTPAEVYNVVELYPKVELPQSTLSAISCDESLCTIQEQIDYLAAELETTQNALNNQIMTLTNKAKEELVARQQSADESLVLQAIEEPETMRVLASVLRIMQQSNKAGVLLEALDIIENGSATSAMARLATNIAPTYNTPMYEPTETGLAVPSYTQEQAVEVIKTTAAPSAKWKP